MKNTLPHRKKISDVFQNKKKWNEMVIRNIAGSGRFSSDRTVSEYAKYIWGIQPNLNKLPAPNDLKDDDVDGFEIIN